MPVQQLTRTARHRPRCEHRRPAATLPPVTPGEVLREEFLVPLALSARQLAAEIDVPPNRITGILNGTRAITADTAIRLGARFRTTPHFWMNLQTGYDLELAGIDGSAIPVLQK